jgi:hypothetical protein
MLERFRKNTFRNGVHPPEMKDDTAELAIRQFPFAPVLIVPLSQHLGKPAKPVVREGQEVIHPGLPRDRSEKDIDKWIKRGEKFN